MAECPHCNARAAAPLAAKNSPENSGFDISGKVRKATMFAAAGFASITLMACYGMAPLVTCDQREDLDGDGFQTCIIGGKNAFTSLDLANDPWEKFDCDDQDPNIHPNRSNDILDPDYIVDTPGDSIDQNCDGVDGMKQ